MSEPNLFDPKPEDAGDEGESVDTRNANRRHDILGVDNA